MLDGGGGMETKLSFVGHYVKLFSKNKKFKFVFVSQNFSK